MSASPDPGSVVAFRARYDEWDQRRKALSAQEETGPTPDPDDWAGSDDEAVELLHDATKLIDGLSGGPLA